MGLRAGPHAPPPPNPVACHQVGRVWEVRGPPSVDTGNNAGCGVPEATGQDSAEGRGPSTQLLPRVGGQRDMPEGFPPPTSVGSTGQMGFPIRSDVPFGWTSTGGRHRATPIGRVSPVWSHGHQTIRLQVDPATVADVMPDGHRLRVPGGVWSRAGVMRLGSDEDNLLYRWRGAR